jgi:glycosyltransferase involved in cell wall biosynthesis
MPTGGVVLVTPLAPAPTGNGLAMRAGMFLEALAAQRAVDVVIVPVVGPGEPHDWASRLARRVVVVPPVGAASAGEHVRAQLADAVLRARLERTSPLPQRARLAPPTLVTDAVAALGEASASPVAVVSMREYLAPFGIWLARHLHATRTVIDLDDDAEALLHELGHDIEAAAYGRLARAWLPDAHLVTLSSPREARQVAARYELETVETVPNTVHAPPAKPASPASASIGSVPGADAPDDVLFVGNLTYEPNIDAARTLVDEILPVLRQLRPTATVTLVGSHDRRLAGVATRPGVTLAGEVDDVGGWYERVGAVVVPLRFGSGTRIKVIEAFAHRRPVVATPLAVAGLAVTNGVDVLIAEEPHDIALRIMELLGSPELAHDLTTAAFTTYEDHYAPDAVMPIVRQAVLGEPDAVPQGAA